MFLKSAIQKLKTKCFVIILLQTLGNFKLISCNLLYILNFISKELWLGNPMTGFIGSKVKVCVN